jgi:Na+/H+ antiporter NhaA
MQRLRAMAVKLKAARRVADAWERGFMGVGFLCDTGFTQTLWLQ